MTIRIERAFSHADRTVWIAYPMPARVLAGVPIQRFRDEADRLEPSPACRREIRAWYQDVTGAARVRLVAYR